MHKNPIGFRFIIASKNCSTKPLSKVVSKIFRLFIEQIENFHKKSKFLSGYNKFWVLKNVEPIVDLLKNVNRGGQATLIFTYDFSTLYTKIPHQDLIAKLNSIIDFVFEGGVEISSVLVSLGEPTGERDRPNILVFPNIH